MEEIYNHRKEIIDNMQKSFGETSSDVEKAVAEIGEIRHWSDGDYRKVEYGKWEKVSNGKSKPVASSSITKKIREHGLILQSKWEDAKKAFEESLEIKYPRGTAAYNVFFQNAWANEQSRNEFIKRIREEQADLYNEIKEIQKRASNDKASVSGKKEITETDLNNKDNPFSEAQNLFRNINKEIPRTGTAREILPKVRVDDYYLDTEVTFRSVLKKNEDWREIDEHWKEMKESGKYDYHSSPKSNSEYLIDHERGEIYRFSDHWGIVASCTWNLESENGNKWNIAKANIRDFKRKDTGIYFNPQYRMKMVEGAELVLPRLKKLTSDNQDFYLTKKAKQTVLKFVDKIFHDLRFSAIASMDEIDRLKKKYESI